MRIQKVGIYWNPEKPNAVCFAARLAKAFLSRGVAVCADARLKREMDLEQVEETEGYAGCDLLAVFGGDGTLIGALNEAVEREIPLLGVNLGRMGFLTETEPESLERDVYAIVRGEYSLDERMLLEASLPSGDAALALNEISILRKADSIGVTELEIRCDGELVDRISGDGVLIAAPTGSTAYSLAAGGPIVAPGLDCIVVTPVCAHSLRSRPFVLKPESLVEVRPTGARGGASVYADGKPVGFVDPGASVAIARAKRKAVFIRLRPDSFFGLMRQKFADWAQE